MFFDFNHPSVRPIGRWAPIGNRLCATATGSSLEIAFEGDFIRLDFYLKYHQQPYPHIWLQVDGGPRFEMPLDWHLHISASKGPHTVTLIYKGAVEQQHRWHQPLVGCVPFMGYEAEKAGVLAPDTRKTIEFIGDSITEGVLVDDGLGVHGNAYGNSNGPLQNDVCADYSRRTAEALNLRSYHCGYGATGLTRSGSGGVPKASEHYPYCFEGAPVPYGHPDFILINHGTNDRDFPKEEYPAVYRAFLKQVRTTHPKAKIIALTPFGGGLHQEIAQAVETFNREENDDVFYINSTGWISPEPIHPLREGHRIVAEHLIPILKEKYNL